MSHADWMTREELKALTAWTERHIFRKQSTGELKVRKTDVVASNGKPVLEYDAFSLPAKYQAMRLQQRMATQALVAVKHSSTAIATLPAPDSEQVTMSLKAASEEDQAQARARLEILAPMIDFKNKTNGHKPVFAVGGGIGKEITSLSGIVDHLSSSLGYSKSTIWEWWKRYKQPGGAANLADRTRSDNGKSRYFEDHSSCAECDSGAKGPHDCKNLADWARNKFLSEKRASIQLIHREMLRQWPRLRRDETDQPPDYSTLRLFLKRDTPALVKIVAREGERAYMEKAAPFIIRDVEAKRVNEYWISDHMLHDVWVRNDGVFGELGGNEAFRPVLTCITDMKSRRVVGTAWCVNPSSNTISSALQFALRHFGKPENFYIDNGKDFKRMGKQAPPMPEPSPDAAKVLFNLGVLVRLGIQPQHCLPFNPQSKQIERFFGTLHEQFDVIWGDAYAGNSPKDRPEECDALLREHAKLMKARRGDESPLPPASVFIQAACDWVDEFNQTHRHSGQGMRLRTPVRVYDAELPPARRAVVDIKTVAPLFWHYQERMVQEGGAVKIHNCRYEPADAESAARLMLAVTTAVFIACDPLNLGEAIAFDADKNFLGHLRSQEMLVHGETTQEELSARMRAKRHYLKAVKTYQKAMERSRQQAGDQTLLESLESRSAARRVQPIIHALPVLKAVNAPDVPRMQVDDIVDSLLDEE